MAAPGDPGWAGAAPGNGSGRIRGRPRAGVRLKWGDEGEAGSQWLQQ